MKLFRNKKNLIANEKGTVLITLLVFVVIATIVIGTFTIITIINTQSTTSFSVGDQVHHLAEVGIENSVLGILRDPNNYTGETLNIDDGNITVNISGTTTKTIVVTATKQGFTKRIELTGDINNNTFTITNWKEIN